MRIAAPHDPPALMEYYLEAAIKERFFFLNVASIISDITASRTEDRKIYGLSWVYYYLLQIIILLRRLPKTCPNARTIQ